MTAVDILTHADTLIYVETFSPDMAKKWLDANTDNRAEREQDVAKYARDMESGNWHFTGDPVRRSITGKLLDGQHRLMAVLKSGVTIDLLVVDGLQDDTQVVMDTGRKRTFANQLQIRKESDSTVIAALLRQIIVAQQGQPVHANYQASHSEMDKFLADNPEVRYSAALARHVTALLKVAPTPVAFAHWLAAQNDRTKAAEFFTRLADGAGLFPGSPIYTLRERFIRSRANQERLTTAEQTALILLAWNAYQENRPLTKLQLPKGGLNNSNFPVAR